jgi:hypothetical protein
MSSVYNVPSIPQSQRVGEIDVDDESVRSPEGAEDGELGDAEEYDPSVDINEKFPNVKAHTLELNMEGYYTRQWEGREAFREFYQNWFVLPKSSVCSHTNIMLGWTAF